MASSIPCNAIFANKGDATPPCGVPRSVAWNTSCSTYPALPPLLDEFPSGNWTNGIAEIFVRDVVECASDIGIEHPLLGLVWSGQSVDLLDGVMATSPWPESVATSLTSGFPGWFKGVFDHCLNAAIPDTADSARPSLV